MKSNINITLTLIFGLICLNITRIQALSLSLLISKSSQVKLNHRKELNLCSNIWLYVNINEDFYHKPEYFVDPDLLVTAEKSSVFPRSLSRLAKCLVVLSLDSVLKYSPGQDSVRLRFTPPSLRKIKAWKEGRKLIRPFLFIYWLLYSRHKETLPDFKYALDDFCHEHPLANFDFVLQLLILTQDRYVDRPLICQEQILRRARQYLVDEREFGQLLLYLFQMVMNLKREGLINVILDNQLDNSDNAIQYAFKAATMSNRPEIYNNLIHHMIMSEFYSMSEQEIGNQLVNYIAPIILKYSGQRGISNIVSLAQAIPFGLEEVQEQSLRKVISDYIIKYSSSSDSD